MKSHADNSAFAPSSLEQSYGTSRSMKPSGVPWLGDIPAGWDVKRGKEILAPLKRPIREDDEIVTCFRDGEVTLRRNRREDGFTVAEKEIGYQGVEKGDLIVHGMDGFAGSIGVSDSRGKASPVLIVLNSTENKRFLMYYLRSLALCDVFLSLSTGIRERSCDLRWNKIGNIPYLLPPLPEQRAIADFLDEKCAAIDAIVEEAKAGIEEYAKWKQSVVFEAVTKGLSPHAKMKDSGVDIVGDIPASWEFCRLRFLCSVKTGNQDTQDAVSDGLYPFFVRSPIVERSNSFTFDGTAVLMAGDGAGAGKIFHLFSGKMAIHQRVYCFHEFKDIRPKFFFYFMQSRFGAEIEKGSAKSTVPSVRLPMLLDFRICLPPFEEQDSIIAKLDEKCSSIDALIEEKKNLIEDLGTYKKSLIYETVTGKRRSRQ